MSLSGLRSFAPILVCSLGLFWILPVAAAAETENHGAQIDTVPLRKGQPAPFDGQLLSTEAAIRIVLEDEHSARRHALEVEHTRKLGQVALEHERERRRIDREAHKRQLSLADRALEKADPWYRAPVVVAPVTFVLALVMVWVAGQAGN